MGTKTHDYGSLVYFSLKIVPSFFIFYTSNCELNPQGIRKALCGFYIGEKSTQIYILERCLVKALSGKTRIPLEQP